jgi:hypothetical protein
VQWSVIRRSFVVVVRRKKGIQFCLHGCALCKLTPAPPAARLNVVGESRRRHVQVYNTTNDESMIFKRGFDGLAPSATKNDDLRSKAHFDGLASPAARLEVQWILAAASAKAVDVTEGNNNERSSIERSL